MTLEDETGVMNLVLKPEIWTKHQEVVMFEEKILAYGILQQSRPIVYINVLGVKGVG